MNDFLKTVQTVTRIDNAVFVPSGQGAAVHKNRAYHGLAIHLGESEKLYTFTDGTRLTVKGGEIIFLPKGSCYTVSAKVGGDCYCINFTVADKAVYPPFVCAVKNVSEMLSLFKEAVTARESRTAGFEEKCLADLYRVIYRLKREAEDIGYLSGRQREILKTATDYISKNYTSGNISIPELAALCRVSEVYLRRLFSRQFGCTPVAYINNLRIAYARELLISGECSVSDAAALSGFNDISYFSREFKKATGVSPGSLI